MAVASHFLLDLPWLWGFMLGFVLAAVSPGLIVTFTMTSCKLGEEFSLLVTSWHKIKHIITLKGYDIFCVTSFINGPFLIKLWNHKQSMSLAVY